MTTTADGVRQQMTRLSDELIDLAAAGACGGDTLPGAPYCGVHFSEHNRGMILRRS